MQLKYNVKDDQLNHALKTANILVDLYISTNLFCVHGAHHGIHACSADTALSTS